MCIHRERERERERSKERELANDIIINIAYCLLPIAYCLLPIAYCLLIIAYCLLPIAYRLLPKALWATSCLCRRHGWCARVLSLPLALAWAVPFGWGLHIR